MAMLDAETHYSPPRSVFMNYVKPLPKKNKQKKNKKNIQKDPVFLVIQYALGFT